MHEVGRWLLWPARVREAVEMRSLDLFRYTKVPGEFTEASIAGGACSLTALLVMAIMMAVEIWVFLSPSPMQTKVDIDVASSSHLRYRTLCARLQEYASVQR